jgi:hypothetical protein
MSRVAASLRPLAAALLVAASVQCGKAAVDADRIGSAVVRGGGAAGHGGAGQSGGHGGMGAMGGAGGTGGVGGV